VSRVMGGRGLQSADGGGREDPKGGFCGRRKKATGPNVRLCSFSSESDERGKKKKKKRRKSPARG